MNNRLTFPFLASSLFLALILISIRGSILYYSPHLSANEKNASTQAIGHMIFTEYLIAFEALSILLLAAMIGAIFIAKREAVD